jgi:hypothetical protein
MLAGVAVTYLFCGINIGMALRYALPATSYAGVAYIAVIWPAWVMQTQTGWSPPVPRWCFNYGDH